MATIPGGLFSDLDSGAQQQVDALMAQLGLQEDDFLNFPGSGKLDKLHDFGTLDGNGNTKLTGNGNDDMLVGNIGNNKLQGQGHDDAIVGAAGNDTEDGGGGNDTLFGGLGNDNLDGGKGNDTVSGDEGHDKITGGAGNDQLSGGTGNDTIDGAGGNDTVDGGAGKDNLKGGDGNDDLKGGGGNDTIAGGGGNDTVTGGGGDDQLRGDGGKDVFVLHSNSGVDTIQDLKNGDVIQIDAHINSLNLASPSDLLPRIGSDSHGNAVIDLGGGNSVTIAGVSESNFKAHIASFVHIV